MNEPTMETVARRLNKVERENRRRKHAEATVVTWLCLSMLLVSPALADQTQIRNYDKARKLHWQKLYPHGGLTFYCGVPFENKTGLNVEHIYPASSSPPSRGPHSVLVQYAEVIHFGLALLQ